MRPKYTTSFRPHGKWGDFLACVIPVSWCINILINSNFILRLIEWQNEASLFTIRVRGRQWYWVYKFELKNFTDILSTPKNVGTNKWQLNVFGELQTADDYLHILQLRSQNKWIKDYWAKALDDSLSQTKQHVILPEEKLISFTYENLATNDLTGITLTKTNLLTEYQFTPEINFTELNTTNQVSESYSSSLSFIFDSAYDSFDKYLQDLDLLTFLNIKNNTFSQSIDIKQNVVLSPDVLESSLLLKRPQGNVSPIRFIKNTFFELSDLNTTLTATSNANEQNFDLFRLRYNDNQVNVAQKPLPHTTYLTFKQKRYKRKKIIPNLNRFTYDEDGQKSKKPKFSYKALLLNNAIIEDSSNLKFNVSQDYRMFKKNKIRSENFSVVTSRRLLRTKKILVIPAHINMTIISNSYDVVHAWWIPALGIKIDCVPGRSTHHTFYVDNVGFYYGQCAEICGRYHHHMPIRLCALPFEHFLVWWYTFGLPKLLTTKPKRRLETIYGFRKYSW